MRGPLAFLGDCRGAAAAEMTLVLPMLLVMMFGGFEAGHYFYTEQKIVKAVREGARYGGRLPFINFPCDGSATTAATQIRQVTLTGTIAGTSPRIPGWQAGDITVTHACNAAFAGAGIYAGNAGAPVVTVAAEASYPSLFGALGFLDDTVVRASAQAAVNGI